MKRKVLFLVLLGCLALFGSAAIAQAAAHTEEPLQFPEDVMVVAAPQLPSGYASWDNQASTCPLPDGRSVAAVSFIRFPPKYGKMALEYVWRYSLGNREFAYLHLTVFGRWEAVQGEIYFLPADGAWRRVNVTEHISYLRALTYLRQARTSLGVTGKEISVCMGEGGD